MTNDLYAVIFAPSTSLSDKCLFRLASILKGLPDTELPETLEDFGNTDFLDHLEGYPMMINGLDVVLDAYQPGKHENLMGVPDGLGYLVISMQQSSLLGMPDQYQAFLGLIQEAFLGLDAIYASTIQEYELRSGTVSWEELRLHTGGIHIFSRDIVAAVGRERLLTHAPDGGALRDGGVWLRFQEEFFYGMPVEYQEVMKVLLEEMWTKVGGL